MVVVYQKYFHAVLLYLNLAYQYVSKSVLLR